MISQPEGEGGWLSLGCEVDVVDCEFAMHKNFGSCSIPPFYIGRVRRKKKMGRQVGRPSVLLLWNSNAIDGSSCLEYRLDALDSPIQILVGDDEWRRKSQNGLMRLLAQQTLAH